MKKLLVITMVGMMLTGVGCKQTDKVAKNVDKNTKQIEEHQEEKPVEEKKDSDEERYIKAEEYVKDIVSKNDNPDGSIIVVRVDNCITIRTKYESKGYRMSDIYAYGYTKQEAYELCQFDVMFEALNTFAATGQIEARRRFGDDIVIVVDSYFGEDRIYCVDGYGNVEYNYFDEQ